MEVLLLLKKLLSLTFLISLSLLLIILLTGRVFLVGIKERPFSSKLRSSVESCADDRFTVEYSKGFFGERGLI